MELARAVARRRLRQHHLPHHLMRYHVHMRTTVTLDDGLLEKAQALTGTKERSILLREALEALVERESARRLAQLGGTLPHLADVPRRR